MTFVQSTYKPQYIIKPIIGSTINIGKLTATLISLIGKGSFGAVYEVEIT